MTRMTPARREEVENGGSLYWVIAGAIQCRSEIVSLETVDGDDGIRRCAIVMSPEIVRTAAAPRRPFQGWRYLKPEDAPRDPGGPLRGRRRPAAAPAGEIAGNRRLVVPQSGSRIS